MAKIWLRYGKKMAKYPKNGILLIPILGWCGMDDSQGIAQDTPNMAIWKRDHDEAWDFWGSNSGDKQTQRVLGCSFPWIPGMISSGCQELALIQLILNYYPDGDEA